MDLDQFSKRIGDIAKGLSSGVDDYVRKFALRASQTIIMATPVDTGRARANWQISIGTLVSEETGSVSASEALSRNEATIGMFHASLGQNLYLQNNVPYIARLNDGWSAQAPAGFVQKALIAAAAAVQSEKVLE